MSKTAVDSRDCSELQGTRRGNAFGRESRPGDGKTIQPTGKKFKLQMATFAHWSGDRFDKEILIWDDQAFMKHIGLAQ